MRYLLLTMSSLDQTLLNIPQDGKNCIKSPITILYYALCRVAMNTSKVTFAALAAMAVALSVAMLVSSVAAPVAAKISPPACTTSSGHQPPGQQPTCQGEGLTQKPATNPAGHAPPGQQ
jgi:hypothetical protein